jgi:hypothetical protein
MISWVTWISMGLVCAFTIWLISHYASKSTAIYVYIFVFLAYFLSFALAVFLPYDIYLSLAPPSDEISSLQFWLVIYWEIVYWTVFVLCWY